jgi:hypothetical protein
MTRLLSLYGAGSFNGSPGALVGAAGFLNIVPVYAPCPLASCFTAAITAVISSA